MATPRVDRRLRIAFVVSTLEVGGLQRAIATIARNLDRDRAEMEVVALRRQHGGSTLMYDTLEQAGVTVHDLGITGRAEREPRALAAAVTKLRRLFAARGYDIVDSAVLEADGAPVGAQACLLAHAGAAREHEQQGRDRDHADGVCTKHNLYPRARIAAAV